MCGVSWHIGKEVSRGWTEAQGVVARCKVEIKPTTTLVEALY